MELGIKAPLRALPHHLQRLVHPGDDALPRQAVMLDFSGNGGFRQTRFLRLSHQTLQ